MLKMFYKCSHWMKKTLGKKKKPEPILEWPVFPLSLWAQVRLYNIIYRVLCPENPVQILPPELSMIKTIHIKEITCSSTLGLKTRDFSVLQHMLSNSKPQQYSELFWYIRQKNTSLVTFDWGSWGHC